ncbi:MAG: phosphodiesterase [Clostridia bacterium]|nr:phosphodiesterase [Clostridia bacterium]
MKYLVASDIHGSAFYCKQLISVFEYEKPDKIILLGDLLYHGPRNDLPKEYDPKQVIEMLNNYKNKILCVRGNCDGEVDQMVLSFPIMADYAVLYTAGRNIYITHGHKFNLNSLPPLQRDDVILHGHTHIPAWQSFGDNNIYLNPGSVSIPKENSPHSYMIIEDELVMWKTIDGNTFHSMYLN